MAVTEKRTDLPNRNKNYNGIDVAKFICAILVLIIHIAPFRRYSWEMTQYLNDGLQKAICRIAVPFFFVSSGFFLFRKTDLADPQIGPVKDYCFKIIRLIGTWTILLFLGGTDHLWYLSATVVAVILLYLLLRLRIKRRYLYAAAFVFYLTGLLGDAYYGFLAPVKEMRLPGYLLELYEDLFRDTRNGVFMGFPFVLMGATFAHCDIRLRPRITVPGLLVSLLCLLGEAFFLMAHAIPRDYNMYVSLLPATFFLFCLASGVTLPDRPVYKQLRITGVLVFFLHEQVNQIAILAVRVFKKITGIRLTPYQFLVSLALTLAAAAVIAYLSGKERFRWLKLLYS